MPTNNFDHIDTWIFDLDQTLYPKSIGLEKQVVLNMRRFIAAAAGITPDEADKLGEKFFLTYGSCLVGATAELGIDQESAYRTSYWELDLEKVNPNQALRAMLAALPGRKIIFTNATRYHAERVLKKMNLLDMFEVIVDVKDMGYVPKPDPVAFDKLIDITGVNPATSIFFEDSLRNLKYAKSLGMSTVHITDKPAGEDFVDLTLSAPEDFSI